MIPGGGITRQLYPAPPKHRSWMPSPLFRLFLAALLVAVLWWLWTHDEPVAPPLNPDEGEVRYAVRPYPQRCKQPTDCPLYDCLNLPERCGA